MTRHPQLTEIDRVMRKRREASRARLDLDFDAFVVQVKALPVFADCPRSIKNTTAQLVHTSFDHNSGGRAHGNARVRIRVSFSPSPSGEALTEEKYRSNLAWLLETTVHELVHCALPSGTVHNERFRRTLARAVRELWGIEVDPNPTSVHVRPGQYELDHNIERILEDRLAEGLDYPRRVVASKPPKPSRAEVMSKVVEKRAAHAAKMFAKAEKRAKAAQRTLTKWRQKARYYERQAAKKAQA